MTCAQMLVYVRLSGFHVAFLVDVVVDVDVDVDVIDFDWVDVPVSDRLLDPVTPQADPFKFPRVRDTPDLIPGLPDLLPEV